MYTMYTGQVICVYTGQVVYGYMGQAIWRKTKRLYRCTLDSINRLFICTLGTLERSKQFSWLPGSTNSSTVNPVKALIHKMTQQTSCLDSRLTSIDTARNMSTYQSCLQLIQICVCVQTIYFLKQDIVDIYNKKYVRIRMLECDTIKSFITL